MQYGQRKLHRSMTEMRKSCSGRPRSSWGRDVGFRGMMSPEGMDRRQVAGNFLASRYTVCNVSKSGRVATVAAMSPGIEGDSGICSDLDRPGRKFDKAIGAKE